MSLNEQTSYYRVFSTKDQQEFLENTDNAINNNQIRPIHDV